MFCNKSLTGTAKQRHKNKQWMDQKNNFFLITQELFIAISCCETGNNNNKKQIPEYVKKYFLLFKGRFLLFQAYRNFANLFF